MDFLSNPKKYAHPTAIRLMNEDFFWSPIDEAGPFGSDSGSDAAAGFQQWRKSNETVNPVEYLSDVLIGWAFPLFDWNELDPSRIRDFIQVRANIVDLPKHVDQLSESLKNSSSDLVGDLSDQALQDLVLKSSENMGGIYLLEMDNAIIGTGFAQFALEGTIHPDLHYLTQTALQRQLLPVLIDRYSVEHRDVRREMLMKMLAVTDLFQQFMPPVS